MSSMIARQVQSQAESKLQTISTFVEMLAELKSFIDNPKILKSLGDQAASAIAVTSSEQAKRDQLVLDAEEAEKALADLKQTQEQITIARDNLHRLHQENVGKLNEQQDTLNKQNEEKAKMLSETEQDLNQKSINLEEKQKAFEEALSDFNKKKADQDAREESLKALQDKIDNVKGALGIKG